MSIDIARLETFLAFDDVIRKKAYSNLAIKQAMDKLEGRDKAFSSALFYGCLEKIITLDFILQKYLKTNPKPIIKNILRMGVYQIYFMDRVPDHAALQTSSEIAKKLGKTGAVGFINGVLRNATRDKTTFEIPDDMEAVKYLSVKYSFPEWMIKMWIGQLGKQNALKLISYDKENTFTIYPNTLKQMTEQGLEDTLSKLKIPFEKSKMGDVYRVGGEVFDTPLLKEGKMAVQGEASHLAAKIVVENEPRTVLDLCASPGGKTAAMAHFNPECEYTACDVSQKRVELMQRQLTRLGMNANTYCMDATKPNDSLGMYDSVLVDAPCSALGTVFNHPEVRYSKTVDDIKEIKKIQKAILQNAASYVKISGRLIYATCTINKHENYDVVKDFLNKNSEFKAVFPKTLHGIINDKRFDGCGVQLLPSEDGTAGFYIACLEKIDG